MKFLWKAVLWLLPCCWSLEALSGSLSEVPLTIEDIKAAMEAGDEVLALPAAEGPRRCMLSSRNPGKGCTWRREKVCKKVPTSVRVPVYSPWCLSEGQGVHVSNCKVVTRTEPLVHLVRICSMVAQKSCTGPCYNCPTFCRDVPQKWCEKTHQVKTITRLEKECENENSGNCEKKTSRIEEDIVEELNNCQEKEGKEMCATINCRFVNETEECSDRETTTLIQLTTRKCTLCEPTLGSKVEVEEICEEEVVDDCSSDPLKRKWRKLCESDSDFDNPYILEGRNNLFQQEEKFRSNQDNAQRNVLFKDILDKSLSPVNDLVVETLKKIHLEDLDKKNPVVVIPTRIDQQKHQLPSDGEKMVELAKIEERILKEELEILEKVNNKPTNINLNVKYEIVTKPSTVTPTVKSVYFDPLLQLIDTQIQADPLDTQKSLSQETTPKPQEVAVGLNNLSAIARPLISDTNTDETKEITNVESTTKNTKELTNDLTTSYNFHPTESILESKTTHLIPHTTEDNNDNENIRIPKTLTAADYLKLCFASGTGCDFSVNKNNVIVPTNHVKSSTELATVTEPPIKSTTRKIQLKKTDTEKEKQLKARVRLCFFAGICNDDDIAEQKEIEETTTTTTRRPRVNKSSRKEKSESSRIMEERIRLRAYLCFSEGKCD